ncbi:type II toxin-antitoxin system RelE/ParE family toxin [Aliirhizobium smilacinae]|uniref:type II toxin-antitoxin system RelE/ParE family toxin n=1 Tax=Aliirhizobium smilacinae TaxID=1395944 RepID=UPI0015D63FB5|nr:type II toxin-antitoxin system RelE/ParE family toxin [Rhizobium smilacinae]
MVEVRLRRTAKSDLRGIGRYTREHWSADQAGIYVDQLLDVIEQIGDHPFSGQDVSDIREGYRRRAAGHHLIFYAVMADDSVEIARILNEKVDIRRHLDEQL